MGNVSTIQTDFQRNGSEGVVLGSNSTQDVQYEAFLHNARDELLVEKGEYQHHITFEYFKGPLCTLMCVALAIVLSAALPPKFASPNVRHIYSGFIGFCMHVFCHGTMALNLIVLVAGTYAMIRTISPNQVHYYVMAFSMMYLSTLHLWHLRVDYNNEFPNILCAMMIMVTKMTSVGFNVFDGSQKNLLKVCCKVLIKKIFL